MHILHMQVRANPWNNGPGGASGGRVPLPGPPRRRPSPGEGRGAPLGGRIALRRLRERAVNPGRLGALKRLQRSPPPRPAPLRPVTYGPLPPSPSPSSPSLPPSRERHRIAAQVRLKVGVGLTPRARAVFNWRYGVRRCVNRFALGLLRSPWRWGFKCFHMYIGVI